MAEKQPQPKSPFHLALAARRGDLPPESLVGAAKRLYNDKSLTREALEGYTKAQPSHSTKTFNQVRTTFKRG